MGLAEQVEIPFHALPPVLDLAGAELLHQQLRTACAHESGIALNGAEVERVSTARLQILAAAARSMHDRGLPFTLDAPSTRRAGRIGPPPVGRRAVRLGREHGGQQCGWRDHD